MEPITLEIAKQSLSNLPALPLHMTSILQTIDVDDLDIDELAKRISCEPTIVMRLLRVSNSPFYGVKGTVSSINRAVQILGLSNVKQIVSALVFIGRIPLAENIAFPLETFWKQSMTVGVFSNEIASHLRSNDKNQAFTAGLLHDFGQLLLAIWYPDKFKLILQEALKDESKLFELETQYFGLDHCELGALLAEQWDLPSELCIALRYRHRPELSNSQLAWILFAAKIMYELSDNNCSNEKSLKLLETACNHLSLTTSECVVITRNALNRAEAFASAI